MKKERRKNVSLSKSDPCLQCFLFYGTRPRRSAVRFVCTVEIFSESSWLPRLLLSSSSFQRLRDSFLYSSSFFVCPIYLFWQKGRRKKKMWMCVCSENNGRLLEIRVCQKGDWEEEMWRKPSMISIGGGVLCPSGPFFFYWTHNSHCCCQISFSSTKLFFHIPPFPSFVPFFVFNAGKIDDHPSDH